MINAYSQGNNYFIPHNVIFQHNFGVDFLVFYSSQNDKKFQLRGWLHSWQLPLEDALNIIYNFHVSDSIPPKRSGIHHLKFKFCNIFPRTTNLDILVEWILLFIFKIHFSLSLQIRIFPFFRIFTVSYAYKHYNDTSNRIVVITHGSAVLYGRNFQSHSTSNLQFLKHGISGLSSQSHFSW